MYFRSNHQPLATGGIDEHIIIQTIIIFLFSGLILPVYFLVEVLNSDIIRQDGQVAHFIGKDFI